MNRRIELNGGAMNINQFIYTGLHIIFKLYKPLILSQYLY